MDEVKDQEWVIDEDELALENSIFKKHQGEHEPRSEKKKENIIFPSRKKVSIIKETKEIPSYMGEKIIFSLLLIIFPYLLGIFIFFIIVPFWTSLGFNILFSAIDFFDWITHLLFWSIGFIILTFSGISYILYKPKH